MLQYYETYLLDQNLHIIFLLLVLGMVKICQLMSRLWINRYQFSSRWKFEKGEEITNLGFLHSAVGLASISVWSRSDRGK